MTTFKMSRTEKKQSQVYDESFVGEEFFIDFESATANRHWVVIGESAGSVFVSSLSAAEAVVDTIVFKNGLEMFGEQNVQTGGILNAEVFGKLLENVKIDSYDNRSRMATAILNF